MKKSKKINIILILCFIIMITAPLLFVNRISGKVSESENRYLASFPKVFDETTGKIDAKFPTGFKAWLNDNIGFRSFFMNLNNKINFKWFNEINNSNNKVVIGKDNWLFLMNDSSLADVQNANLLSQEQIDFYKNRYSEITKYFKSLGTDLSITVFPQKSNMYSEYLPDNILRINNESLIDEMKDKFEGNDNFDLNVPSDVLRKAKESRVIYSKAYDQSHWNNYGGFIGYTEIMKQAKKHIPNLKILTEDDFNITPYEKDTVLDGSKFTTETDYDFKLKSEPTASSDKSFFDKINYKSNDPWKSYNYFVNKDKTLPKAIVVGDSYVWMFMLNNMAESFSQLVFIHQLDIGNLNKIYSEVKPDIIIGAGLDNTVLGLADYQPPLINPTSEIISDNTPTEIKRGEKYNVDITVKNTSNEIWKKEKNVKLCIFQNGVDYGYRLEIPDGKEIRPGEEYTFVLRDFQAPSNAESTYLEYQMVQEGVTYFGDKRRVDIKVDKK